jgi:uncharacterized protein
MTTLPAQIASLYIYPVKSLGGFAVSEARLTDRGFRFDRRWMIVDLDDEFVTQRDCPAMATIWVDVDDVSLTLSTADHDPVTIAHGANDGGVRTVQVWDSQVMAHAVSRQADNWLSEVLQRPLRLMYMPDQSHRACSVQRAPGHIVSFADGYPFLLANAASLDDLNQRITTRSGHASALPMSRFRPNIVLTGWPAWQEDQVPSVRLGKTDFRLVKPCGRCQVTTTDQASGQVVGPEPLATLATFREDAEFGVTFGWNAVSANVGAIVRVGDPVTVPS